MTEPSDQDGAASDGRDLLLIHGFPLNGTLWRHQASAFAGWRCVAPDLRGFGSGLPPQGTGELRQYTDDMVALLDGLKIRQAVVCGLSMGGYVALDLARRYPQRLLALGLFSTRAEPDSVDGMRARDATTDLVKRAGLESLADSMIPKLLGKAPGLEMQLAVRAMIVGSSSVGVLAGIRAMRERADARPFLEAIRVPTLVLVGTEDTLIPPSAGEFLAASIPGARLGVVERAGHLVPLEQPTLVNNMLTDFLGSLA